MWSLGHEFLWGDDLLVAPVTREGATAWPVYLPAGALVRLLDGHALRGPGGHHRRRSTRSAAPARAGGRHRAHGAGGPAHRERPLDEVTLLIYPEGASRFELYEDDGRSNAYRLRGDYALTRFECEAAPGRVTVRIGEPVGARSVIPAGRRYLIRIRIDGPRSVDVTGHGPIHDGTARATDAGWWEDGSGFTVIRLPGRPALTVTIART